MPTRRTFLAAGLAAAALPLRAADGTAERRFEVFRDGDPIGTQSVAVSRVGDRLEVASRVDLAVKILGITAYRYELRATEVWEAGRLLSLDGETNDDGDREIARVRREGEILVSQGAWRGEAPSDVGATSYWTQAHLARPVWLSTQTGRPLNVPTSRDGSQTIEALGGRVACARWRAAGDLPVTLYYDDRGEWLGNDFDAGGKPGLIRAVSETGALAPLWSPA